MTEKKLDWDKRLETPDGRDAVLLTRDYKSYGSPRYVVMFTSSVMSTLHLYLPDGSPVNEYCPPLRNKRVKHEAWQNIYRDRMGGYSGARFYKSEELAREQGVDDSTYITTVKIEWEE